MAIHSLLNDGSSSDPLQIVPKPALLAPPPPGDAAIDLRLGRWFLRPRISRVTEINIKDEQDEKTTITSLERNFAKKYFVPFGDSFVIHPGHFVLGATLEWLRLPSDIGGYITGRSSWGRRGLVIETAAGIHPNFSGCLTLEIANLGQVPIRIYPGIKICQVFFHKTENLPHQTLTPLTPQSVNHGHPHGHSRPVITPVKMDTLAQKLIFKS